MNSILTWLQVDNGDFAIRVTRNSIPFAFGSITEESLFK